MLFPFALCPLSFNINTLPRRKLLPSCSRDPWAPARWVFVSSLFFWYCWQIWWTLLFSPQCELEAQGEREDPSLSCASTCCSTPGEARAYSSCQWYLFTSPGYLLYLKMMPHEIVFPSSSLSVCMSIAVLIYGYACLITFSFGPLGIVYMFSFFLIFSFFFFSSP